MGTHMHVHSIHRLACLCTWVCICMSAAHTGLHVYVCVACIHVFMVINICVYVCVLLFVWREEVCACSSSRFKSRGLVRPPGSQGWGQVAEAR